MLTEEDLANIEERLAAVDTEELSPESLFRRIVEDGERLLAEAKRLRILAKDGAAALGERAQLVAENEALKARLGAGASVASIAAELAKVDRLEKSVRELQEAHRREYLRGVELENARAEALRTGSVKPLRSVRERVSCPNCEPRKG